MRSIRSRLAVSGPFLVLVILAALVRDGQKWV